MSRTKQFMFDTNHPLIWVQGTNNKRHVHERVRCEECGQIIDEYTPTCTCTKKEEGVVNEEHFKQIIEYLKHWGEDLRYTVTGVSKNGTTYVKNTLTGLCFHVDEFGGVCEGEEPC